MVALRAGPRSASRLLDDIRAMNGQVRPGTLYSAVARLEHLALIEGVVLDQGRPGYRLTEWRTGQVVATLGGPPA
jgi:DNA-binding PadR family transcriptional regulator